MAKFPAQRERFVLFITRTLSLTSLLTCAEQYEARFSMVELIDDPKTPSVFLHVRTVVLPFSLVLETYLESIHTLFSHQRYLIHRDKAKLTPSRA